MKRNMHVLYLQFEPKVDKNFLTLSRVFSQFGMTLVPITVENFKRLKIDRHEYVLALVKDMRSVKIYRSLLKRYLNYALRTGKATLFEFSSFETLHDSKMLRDEVVSQIRLPSTMFQMAEVIGRKIYKDITLQPKRWPGGRRVKLPTS